MDFKFYVFRGFYPTRNTPFASALSAPVFTRRVGVAHTGNWRLDAYRRTELDRWICDLHHDEAGIHRSVSVRGICMTQTLFVLASHSKTDSLLGAGTPTVK
jgi:hypothetical protein